MFFCSRTYWIFALFLLDIANGILKGESSIISYQKRSFPVGTHGIFIRSPFESTVIDIENKFLINKNTIIRTQDSRSLGAKYLNETELSDNRECLVWCWETTNCNVAVFGDKSKGSCYLFDCGSPSNFQCKFTKHNFYTSSILKSTHSYELGEWGNQVKHENELAKLHNDLAVSDIPVSSSSDIILVSEQPKLATALPSVKSASNEKIEQRCRHYQFQCLNSSECIAIYNVCDGIPQCPDGSDESFDLKCPQKMQDNTKSSPAPTVLQLPTQPSFDQHASFHSSDAGNILQAPASNPHFSQKSSLPHSMPNRHEMQKPQLNADVRNQPSAIRPNENVPWHEGYENKASDSQYKQEFPGDSDSAPSPFIHKHSKFVAANDPHPQYPNRWADDYDQYLHQPSLQQPYNAFGTNYQKPNEHYINNQLPSDFDQATYEVYHPNQNLYWPGQDNPHDNHYEENDFVPPHHQEPGRPIYPERKFFPPRQGIGKQGNSNLYSQSGGQMGQSQDQSGLQQNVPMHSQNTNGLQTFSPYNDQSRLNYPQYPDPQTQIFDYFHQNSLNDIHNNPLRNNVSKQTLVQDKSLHQLETTEGKPTEGYISQKLPNNNKQGNMSDKKALDARKKTEDDKPTENTMNKPIKSSLLSESDKTEHGPIADGLKMTVAELFQSSNTHVHESNSAVLALTLGLCITALLLVLVGCRMRAIRRRISRRGRSLTHDADYLVNGMYL